MKSTERHKLKENEFARTVAQAREALEARKRDITIFTTIVAGVMFAVITAAVMLHKRYAIVRHGKLEEQSNGDRQGMAAAEREALKELEDEMATTTGGSTLRVKGMKCDSCVSKVSTGIGKLDGVASVEVDLASGLVTLKWSDGFAGMDAVRERIRSLGYQVP